LDSSSSISIIYTDLKQNVLFWNKGAENIFGYKAEEVVGRHKIDILYPGDEGDTKDAVEEVRSSIIKNKSGINREIEEIRKDGRKLWISLTSTPRLDENGDVIGILGIGEDITERKRAEEQLQQSLEKFQRALEGTIDVLASVVEMRDPYTGGHQQRVTNLACAIAKNMRLSAEQTEGLRLVATIHDIANIYIPAEILSKTSQLTEIEYETIKTHPQIGYEILNAIEFPWPVAEIVLQHHAMMDGS